MSTARGRRSAILLLGPPHYGKTETLRRWSSPFRVRRVDADGVVGEAQTFIAPAEDTNEVTEYVVEFNDGTELSVIDVPGAAAEVRQRREHRTERSRDQIIRMVEDRGLAIRGAVVFVRPPYEPRHVGAVSGYIRHSDRFRATLDGEPPHELATIRAVLSEVRIYLNHLCTRLRIEVAALPISVQVSHADLAAFGPDAETDDGMRREYRHTLNKWWPEHRSGPAGTRVMADVWHRLLWYEDIDKVTRRVFRDLGPLVDDIFRPAVVFLYAQANPAQETPLFGPHSQVMGLLRAADEMADTDDQIRTDAWWRSARRKALIGASLAVVPALLGFGALVSALAKLAPEHAPVLSAHFCAGAAASGNGRCDCLSTIDQEALTPSDLATAGAHLDGCDASAVAGAPDELAQAIATFEVLRGAVDPATFCGERAALAARSAQVTPAEPTILPTSLLTAISEGDGLQAAELSEFRSTLAAHALPTTVVDELDVLRPCVSAWQSGFAANDLAATKKACLQVGVWEALPPDMKLALAADVPAASERLTDDDVQSMSWCGLGLEGRLLGVPADDTRRRANIAALATSDSEFRRLSLSLAGAERTIAILLHPTSPDEEWRKAVASLNGEELSEADRLLASEPWFDLDDHTYVNSKGTSRRVPALRTSRGREIGCALLTDRSVRTPAFEPLDRKSPDFVLARVAFALLRVDRDDTEDWLLCAAAATTTLSRGSDAYADDAAAYLARLMKHDNYRAGATAALCDFAAHYQEDTSVGRPLSELRGADAAAADACARHAILHRVVDGKFRAADQLLTDAGSAGLDGATVATLRDALTHAQAQTNSPQTQTVEGVDDVQIRTSALTPAGVLPAHPEAPSVAEPTDVDQLLTRLRTLFPSGEQRVAVDDYARNYP